jgi:nicotinate dehydrogenase subunit B
LANTRVVTHYTQELLRAVYMRSVGGLQNTFAYESTMDDLAVLADADPIEFRLRHLTDERMKAVLRAAAKQADWRPASARRMAEKGKVMHGRGVAIASGDEAYIATIVDVEVEGSTGVVLVKRAAIAVDAGKIMNPDGLRNQIEGGTIMGISRALKEEVKFDGPRVTTIDWATYPVLRFTEAPEALDVVMIDSDNTPMGAGEPPNVTPAAAIANAIFAASGVRIRTLPLTPDRVKAAIAT